MRRILAASRVGVAGAGGLGSNCAASLVRAGVGTIVLADYDGVTQANLDRQYYFRDQVGMPKVEALARTLRAIDPEVRILAHAGKLDEETVIALFAGCDLVVEAFDAADQKAMLVETVLSRLPNADVVAASGLAGVGNLEALRVVHTGRLHICGDFLTEVSDEEPPVAAKVGIVANMEADVAIGLLLSRATDIRLN